MNPSNFDDLSHLSLLELFRVEAENQTAILTSGLLDLERGSASAQTYEMLMRAAHSLKGAARIVNLQAVVRVAHALEDCFVAFQQGTVELRRTHIDLLFRGLDLLAHLTKLTEDNFPHWEARHGASIKHFLEAVTALPRRTNLLASSQGETSGTVQPVAAQLLPKTQRKSTNSPAASAPLEPREPMPQAIAARVPETPERVVRLAADNLNRLLGLAGESLVESRWLDPFTESLQQLKGRQAGLTQHLTALRQALSRGRPSEDAENLLNDLSRQLVDCQQLLSDRLQELDLFERRSAHLSHRLYLEVLRTRMRPFSDGVRRFPRMIRDLARTLDKDVKLEIFGESTQVDREILERLETPLAHLLRNAVDHGCEPSGVRERAGKPLENTLRLEARHSAGMLLVTVQDDGAGVSLERVRQAIVQEKLSTPAVAEKLSESELLEYLFLPGFTLKETVTEISGRGVGLDVVQNLVKSLRGTIRFGNQPGRGFRVQLQLPLTLSVLRALLVEIGGEPYAIPLAQIVQTVKLPREQLLALEGRSHFFFAGQPVGLLCARRILESTEAPSPDHELSIVVLGDRNTRCGLVVDQFLGERELVVQPLDPRLGKIQDVSSAALMEDGAPILILDVDDLLRSDVYPVLDELSDRTRVALPPKRPKRVLAVDDSLSVRELERKIITNRGYLADVAIDGVDGWNAVRSGQYDLVITDVDMPRMDGIELAARIKQDPQFKSLPVMILSYKDGEEDRRRGLEAGADYYLTKGSFKDETLLQAVVDLIGEPGT